MIKYDNTTVRRQERLLDEQTAFEILTDGEYGVLSMVECRGGQTAAYGIPINYVWDGGDYVYFHCAPSGHKLDCVDCNSLVSFTVVGHTKVISNKFTTAYQSIIIRGELTRGLAADERMEALAMLLDKYSPDDKEVGLKYTEKSFDRTEVLRLEIKSMSGKTKRVL